MPSDEVRRWALAVRVLTVLSTLLLVIVALEARTLRQARAELQQVRSEREQANTGAMERQSTRETGDALRWLDTFYSDSTEGFGRRGGLCAEGKLNTDAITSYLLDVFVKTRAEGKSFEAAVAAMKTSITTTDAYRAVHPDRSPQRNPK